MMGAVVVHGLLWQVRQRRWAVIEELVFSGEKLQLLIDDRLFELDGYSIALRRPWLVVLALKGYGPVKWLPLLTDSLVGPDQWRRLCTWRYQL